MHDNVNITLLGYAKYKSKGFHTFILHRISGLGTILFLTLHITTTATVFFAPQWYDVLVDLADGSFVDDVEAIEQAEWKAHRARYDKLEPALFERLETISPDGEVPVAIWVTGRPKRSEQELFTELAAKYPEAQAALERSGKPFDVGDPDLINEIEAEYVRLLEADTQERTSSLVRHLEKRGYGLLLTSRCITYGGLIIFKSYILCKKYSNHLSKI